MVLQLGNITGTASRCPSHKGILPIMRKTSCLHCGKTLPNLLKNIEHKQQGALQFRHLELEPAGLGGRAPLVVAGPVRLPYAGTLVSRGVGDPLDLLAHHGVELALEHGLVELYDFPGHGPAPLSNRGFSLSGD